MNMKLILLASLSALVAIGAEPKRLDRTEAFLGIHFDFHAGKTSTNVGAQVTREMVASIIDRVHPDYIQCDCKGHPGYSSYPTKVGNPAPRIIGDPLRLWREVTRERGVALFMHYSGVADSYVVETHPDWAALRADGKPEARATSVFGPYADRVLIPQLRELAGSYAVDGAWVDGECWAAVPDYSETALRAFRTKYHLEAPRNKGEPLWNDWMDFNREAFRSYLRHYVDALKSSHPNFKLISNWAFSDHMPEPVSANVVSLSGDFSPQNSVNAARFTARCFENQGRAWDLMAWGFNKNTRAPKTAVALQQEAAIVLALGGGFQAYFSQDREGALLHPSDLDIMGEVAKFCRQRQSFCHKSEPVPQVALLYSRAAHYRNSDRLFFPYGDAALTATKSALTNLLAAQYSVQVVSEHHLAGKMSQWPLLVIAGWNYLEPQFKSEVVAYVQRGGQLLLAGESAQKLFAAEVGAAFVPTSGPSFIRDFGRGKIAMVPPGENLGSIAKQFLTSPLVQVAGSSQVDVCVRRLKGKLMINLVNTSGNHANAENKIVETVPPIGPLEIAIRTAKQPKALIVQPGGEKLNAKWQDGIVRATLPRLELYSIVQVEE